MKDNILLLANTLGSFATPTDLGANNQLGTIHLANASRFTEAHFSEPLTTYAVGWADSDDLRALLDFIAPPVTVPRRFEFAKANNDEAFLSESDDVRGVGADFKRVEYTGEKATDRTHNKGLTIRVDIDNIDEDVNPNWRQQYTARLMQRLLRNEIRRAYALLAAACNARNTAKTWSTGATDKNPDIDVLTEVDAFGDGANGAGLNANRVLYGFTAWTRRASGYAAQNTAGAFAASARTPDQVATAVGVPAGGVRISSERYTSATSTKAKLATANLVLIYNALNNATAEDPSNIKRFVTPNGGTPFRVFEQQVNAKLYDITVEHYSNITVTSTLGCRQLTVS